MGYSNIPVYRPTKKRYDEILFKFKQDESSDVRSFDDLLNSILDFYLEKKNMKGGLK